jgi:hypothetical protein
LHSPGPLWHNATALGWRGAGLANTFGGFEMAAKSKSARAAAKRVAKLAAPDPVAELVKWQRAMRGVYNGVIAVDLAADFIPSAGGMADDLYELQQELLAAMPEV